MWCGYIWADETWRANEAAPVSCPFYQVAVVVSGLVNAVVISASSMHKVVTYR